MIWVMTLSAISTMQQMELKNKSVSHKPTTATIISSVGYNLKKVYLPLLKRFVDNHVVPTEKTHMHKLMKKCS